MTPWTIRANYTSVQSNFINIPSDESTFISDLICAPNLLDAFAPNLKLCPLTSHTRVNYPHIYAERLFYPRSQS